MVQDYFELLAGTVYCDALWDGFIDWLARSPDALRQYEEGDDMNRAALVDWFLKVVR